MMKKIRILHAVSRLSFGGIQTWLMHVLRHIDRDRFQMDFLVQAEEPSHFDDEARELGARVIPCTKPARYLTYCRKLSGILRKCGPYDVVHSHVSFSGVVIRVAHQAGVPVRIVHSHNDAEGLLSKGGLSRRLFLAFTNRWISQHATHGFAASETAAAARFGKYWKGDPRWQVLFCSLDLEPFHNKVDRKEVRFELGIPEDALVIGHVGRFDPQKNHQFLVKIAEEVVAREPGAIFLLIGEGSLREKVQRQIDEGGHGKSFRLIGVRRDVPRLMRGAMDLLLFPSQFEGLGLVVIEAQAAGLPCVISENIPHEATQIRELVRRVSLSEPPEVWANVITKLAKQSFVIDPLEARSAIERGPFNIRAAIQQLERCYTSGCHDTACTIRGNR